MNFEYDSYSGTSRARYRGLMVEAVRDRFKVTYGIVTAESVMLGDWGETGFLDRHGSRIAAKIGRPTHGVAMTLREAFALIQSPMEDSGHWFTEIDERSSPVRGESETRAVHPPEGVSQASYGRLKRLLGVIA